MLFKETVFDGVFVCAGILPKYPNKIADSKNISRDSKSFNASKVRNANRGDLIL